MADVPAHSGNPTTVEHEELQRAAAAPVGIQRQEVLLGGGGDPLVFGLPVFVSGSLVLGMALIGVVPVPKSLGSVLPATTFSTGLGEFVTALWAIVLGQSIVASIFGLFAGFWFSLFAMIMGLDHNWYLIPAAQGSHTQEMFFIAWLTIFVFLTVAILRLPLVYIGIVAFVSVAVLFVLLAIELGASWLFVAGGASVLAFCALGLYAFLNVAWTATGSDREWPPLGPPVWQ